MPRLARAMIASVAVSAALMALAAVPADPARLEPARTNLLSNAVDR